MEGNIIKIEKLERDYRVTVLSGNQTVKIKMAESAAKELNKGDKIIVSSKVFEPVIQKITDL